MDDMLNNSNIPTESQSSSTSRVQRMLAYLVAFSIPLESYTANSDFPFISLGRLALLLFYTYIIVQIVIRLLSPKRLRMAPFRQAFTRRSAIILLMVLAYHAALLFSTGVSGIVHLTPNVILRIVASLFVFLVPVVTIRDSRELSNFLVIIVLIALLTESTTLLASFNIMPQLGIRMAVMRGAANEYFSYRSTGLLNAFGDHASIFSFAVPLLLLSMGRGSNPWYPGALNRFFAFFLILFLGISSLALQSRNVWVSSLVSVIVFISFNAAAWIKRTKSGFYLLLAILLLSFGILILSYGWVTEYVKEISAVLITMRQESVASRLIGYNLAYLVFQQNPWFGIGPYGFSTKYGLYIHNVVLNLLVSGGVIATILMSLVVCILLGVLFRGLVTQQSNRSTNILILAGFVGLLTSGMFYGQLSSWIFWFLLGTVAAYSNISFIVFPAKRRDPDKRLLSPAFPD